MRHCNGAWVEARSLLEYPTHTNADCWSMQRCTASAEDKVYTHTSKHTHVGKHIPANVNPTVILVCAMQTHTRTRTFCETSRSHDVCVTLKVPECAWEAGRTCCHTTGVTQYCCKHFSVIIGHMCSQEGTLHFGLPHHSLYACIAA